MLKFDSYYPMDKDLGYTKQDEDHFNDLFEQFLNDDPTPLTSTASGTEDLHALDFAFEEETEPSESSSADSKLTTLNSLPTGLNYKSIQRSLAFRPQRALAQPQPLRAISSSELLSLEGKAPPATNHHKTLSTPSSSSAAPTLRRKAKFCAPAAEAQHGRSERASKKPSREMSRSSFASTRHDSPSYPDWAQRFEHISIQQPLPQLQTSSPRPTATYKDKRPGNISTASHTPSHTPFHDRLPVATPARQEQRPSVCSDISQSSRLVTVAISPTLRAWENHEDVSPMTLSNDNNNRLHAPHLRHADTWSYSPASPLGDGPMSPLSPEFVVSPQHVQPSWLHGIPSNLDSYYQNSGPSPQSSSTAQLSAHAIPDLTPHDLMNYEPYRSFINEDPSSAYSVNPPDNPFQSPTNDFPSHNYYKDHNGDILNGTTQSHPQTPPPFSLPPSPSPLQSPSKHRSLRSKSHRRGLKSLGNLRTPKSASALKQPKSASTLRSPRSTTGTFGFVNFTPDDKSKILTGVAPSGSSKTKQRREQEAMDRKRKSSHVALKAVEAVGGDVERFRREFEREGMELAI
ncbi:hypothetical protein P7C71_g385, partial [Lecanoromycetidae sp. Uapishka_2]